MSLISLNIEIRTIISIYDYKVNLKFTTYSYISVVYIGVIY